MLHRCQTPQEQIQSKIKFIDNWKISVGDVNPEEFEWQEMKFPGVDLTQEETKELERLLKKCSCGRISISFTPKENSSGKPQNTTKEEHISLKPYTLDIQGINCMYMQERFATLTLTIMRAIDVLCDGKATYPLRIRKNRIVVWETPQASETLLSLKEFAQRQGVPWKYHEEGAL